MSNLNLYYPINDAFNANGAGFFGADLFAVPRLQLVAELATLNEVSFAPVSLAGIPIRALEPAISTTPTQTEYLMNSFPFTATARILSTTQLGFWKVENGFELIAGRTQVITLTGSIIQNETYGFPVGAVSTGSGVTTNGITSEAILNPDDSRLLQMQFINGHLLSALTTALTVGSDPTYAMASPGSMSMRVWVWCQTRATLLPQAITCSTRLFCATKTRARLNFFVMSAAPASTRQAGFRPQRRCRRAC